MHIQCIILMLRKQSKGLASDVGCYVLFKTQLLSIDFQMRWPMISLQTAYARGHDTHRLFIIVTHEFPTLQKGVYRWEWSSPTCILAPGLTCRHIAPLFQSALLPSDLTTGSTMDHIYLWFLQVVERESSHNHWSYTSQTSESFLSFHTHTILMCSTELPPIKRQRKGQSHGPKAPYWGTFSVPKDVIGHFKTKLPFEICTNSHLQLGYTKQYDCCGSL